MGNLNRSGTRWTGGKLRRLLLPAVAIFLFVMPARSQAADPLPNAVAQQRSQLLNEDWNPARLYSILASGDTEASENLHRAAFAAGPAIIPQLEKALADDRTAEFAAQTLAYFGDEKSLAILAKLVSDPRDLDLRRFYYGALGGRENRQDVAVLLHKVRTSDQEPDRSVTQNAILALSISADPALPAKLRQAENQVSDPVVQDDIETAAMVVELRAQYLASPAGKSAVSSLEQAIRGYFMPALQAAPGETDPQQQEGQVEIHVTNVTYSPDRMRALAGVDFENPEAVATYHLVLQKNQAGWKVASVWLGEEREKPQTQTPQK